MRRTEERVLITGSRAPVAVALAGTLRAAGFTGFTGDSVRPALGQFGPISQSDLYLPPPRFTSRDEYLEKIAVCVRQHGTRTIVPTCEETFYLAAVAPQLAAETGVRVFSPPLSTLEQLHDKFAFSRFAESLGLSVPETLPLNPRPLLPRCHGVLKRTFSRFGEHILRLGAGDEPPDLSADSFPWLWQRWIDGRSVSTYSLCVAGEIRAHVAYRTPYTLSGGAGVFYESVDGTPSLHIARQIADATAYEGQLSLDFIEDAAGTLWLIECNPRATMGLALLNREPTFAAQWGAALLGGPSPTLIASPGQTVQLRLANLLWGGRSRSADRSLRRWGKDLTSTPDIFWGSAGARLLWGQVRVLSAFQKQARAIGCSLTAFATRDIEWNGAADAQAAQESRSRPVLLETFPELCERFPWTPLLEIKASPVVLARGLSRQGVADVWIKRDDLVCSQYGGNKARKFEWILGDMRAKGHRELWTAGGLCSNHCLAAAVYGKTAKIKVRSFFLSTPVTVMERDFLRVQAELGASLAMLTPRLASLLRLLDPTANRPYLVPPGGSSVAGILGYVDAGLEFCGQVARGECSRPDVIYIAAASRGTVLGLAIGMRLGGIEPFPRIIAVETTTPGWQRARALLPTPALALRRLRAASPAVRRLLPADLREFALETDTRFESLPLGRINAPIASALAAAPDEADLTLDAHYSARAYAALRLDLAAGRWKGKTVLFWHTHGGLPARTVDNLLRSAPPLPEDVARAAARCLHDGDEVAS